MAGLTCWRGKLWWNKHLHLMFQSAPNNLGLLGLSDIFLSPNWVFWLFYPRIDTFSLLYTWLFVLRHICVCATGSHLPSCRCCLCWSSEIITLSLYDSFIIINLPLFSFLLYCLMLYYCCKRNNWMNVYHFITHLKTALWFLCLQVALWWSSWSTWKMDPLTLFWE